MAAPINWLCVVSFTLVSEKIHNKSLSLVNNYYNSVIFNFNDHLFGKYICLKWDKPVNRIILLWNEINIIYENLLKLNNYLSSISNKIL